jgi:hypothetical protein
MLAGSPAPAPPIPEYPIERTARVRPYGVVVGEGLHA